MKATPQEFVNQSVPFYKNRKFVLLPIPILVAIVLWGVIPALGYVLDNNVALSVFAFAAGIVWRIIEGDMKFDRESLITVGVQGYELLQQVQDGLHEIEPEVAIVPEEKKEAA